MSLLRFDPLPSTDDELSDESIAALAPRLDELRTELTETGNPIQDATAPLVRDDRCFFRLPEFQYVDYVGRREESDLGRVFKLANGLHDQIDAVVVLGEPSLVSGAKCLVQACGDPFHNELSRAARGSKPRIYFEPNPHENDALTSLLVRLRQRHVETLAEKRWAIISLHQDGDANRCDSILCKLTSELRESLGQVTDDFLKRLVVSIDATPRTDDVNGFQLPEGVWGANSVLSPAGMLPAAMQGLDCMKLLEGAVAINDHFQSTPIGENIVMQFASRNHLLAGRGRHHRVLSVWSQALQTFGCWYDSLIRQSDIHGPSRITTATFMNPRDLDRFHASCREGKDRSIVHHLFVKRSRCDTIYESADQSMDQSMEAIFGGTLEKSMIPGASVAISHIDTFTLGQLFQLSMIAAWIESRLAGGATSATPDQQSDSA